MELIYKKLNFYNLLIKHRHKFIVESFFLLKIKGLIYFFLIFLIFTTLKMNNIFLKKFINKK